MEAPASTRHLARTLRRRLTRPEAYLWTRLKGRQLDGLHFRKQHPLGPYVLDFYCDAARLCVEVDGQAHGTGDRPERDARRDQWLAEQGVRTLRLRAVFVLEEIEGAIRMILATARADHDDNKG